MEITDVLLIGVIIAIVELLKNAGVPSKLLPFIALVLGLLGGTIYLFQGDIKTGIIAGLMMGLSASGVYSGYSTLKNKSKEEDEDGKNQ